MRVSPGQYAKGRHCGYCDGHGSAIYGFEVFEMTSVDYQALVDRGFRRSGTFVYKPDLKRSCCPQYTIRLEASKYKPSREQRQAINRFNSKLGCSSGRSKKGKDNQFDLIEAAYRAEHEGKLRIIVEPAGFSSEKYELYKKYQIEVHKDEPDEVSPRQFKRFLCDNPFIDEHVVAAHELYYLNDKLVAMSVLDVLPNCLSSVYFIYDPDYRHLGAWGRVSAVHDIAHTVKLNKPYYYMGYYIHSCVKMLYKGAYSPSFLLDPWFSSSKQQQWYPIDDYKKAFSEQKYVAFNAAQPIVDEIDRGRLTSKFVAELPGVWRHAWEVSRVKPSEVPLMAPDAFGNAVMTTVDGISSSQGKILVSQLIFTLGVVIGGDLIDKVVMDFT
ncbi:hypothetical protein TRVA0_047S00694 [Trichomonascus vanleenenianus]|uniref:arginyltransferase n=1 Tax=Trichomonascus vanleenenianus TaxID=2268995 RepID=UPI003EC992A2